MADSHREIRSLTGLRGVAACYVMLYHFSLDALTGFPRRAVRHGYLSVDLFFILSGFVMALTYASRFRNAPNRPTYTEFLRKRFARVYPLYLFITVLMSILIRAHLMYGTWPTAWIFGVNLLLLQAVGLAYSLCLPSWSISTEFFAYLFFPFLVGGIVYGRRAWRWLAIVAGMAIVYRIAGMSSEQLHEAFQAGARHGALDIWAPGSLYPLLRCLSEFFMGVAVVGFSSGHSLTGRYWGIATDLLVLVTLGLLPFYQSDVLLVLLLPPLVYLLSLEKGFAARLLSTRVIHWLGVISYSIYMDHFGLHLLFSDRLKLKMASLNVPHAAIIRGAFLVILTIIVASLTYYLIEKPARDWLGRTPRKPSDRSSAAKDAAIAAEPSAP